MNSDYCTSLLIPDTKRTLFYKYTENYFLIRFYILTGSNVSLLKFRNPKSVFSNKLLKLYKYSNQSKCGLVEFQKIQKWLF